MKNGLLQYCLWCLVLPYLAVVYNTTALAQDLSKDEVVDLADLVFNRAVSEGYLPGASVVIVQGDSVLVQQGYGYTALNTRAPANPAHSVFQLGSIGKLFTAISVLQLVDSGKLDLDADISIYVPDIPINPRPATPITLRALLTHSAGFEDRVIGYGARSIDGIEPLGPHLAENMPSLYTDPGVEISYSNYSYALAGYAVEKASGMAFTDYVKINILQPLHMLRSGYVEDGRFESRGDDIAKGHNLVSGVMKELPAFYRHPTPAGSIYSTGADMAIFMKAILSGGDSILTSGSFDLLTRPQFRNHELLTGYTLGFEEQNFNGYSGFAKGGNLPGYTAVVAFIPELKLGIFVATNVGRDSAIEEFLNAFVSQFLPNRLVHGERKKVSLGRFAGHYRNNRYNRHNIEDVFSLFNGNMQFWTRSDTLFTFHDGFRQAYLPIDDLHFQNVQDPSRLLVFDEDSNGEISAVSLGHKIYGILVPAKLEKVFWLDSPYFINEQFGFVPLFLASYLLLPLFWLALILIRIRKKDFYQDYLLPRGAHAVSLIFVCFVAIWVFLYFVPLIRDITQIFYGMPDNLKKYHWVPFLKIAFVPALIYWSWVIWQKRHGTLAMRLYYNIFVLAAIIWVVFLNRWHFIGFNF